MSAKPKTRLTVFAGGAKVQVLAIGELNDGTLAIFPKQGGDFEREGTRTPMVSNKFSVHPSRASSKRGRTIKHEVRLEDGTLITDVAFILDAHESVCWPITSVRFTPMYNAPVRFRSKDAELELPAYSPGADCLMYTLFLKDKAKDLPDASGYGAWVIPFKEVDLQIYYAYLNFPTPPGMDQNTMSTTPRQFGPPEKNADHIGGISYNAHQLQDYLHNAGQFLIDRMYCRWSEIIGTEDFLRRFSGHRLQSNCRPFNEELK